MKNYVIKVSADLPYPVSEEYRIEATRFAVAIRRGVDKFRKEKGRKKRINEIRVKAVKV
jgi:hypothetical protein